MFGEGAQGLGESGVGEEDCAGVSGSHPARWDQLRARKAQCLCFQAGDEPRGGGDCQPPSPGKPGLFPAQRWLAESSGASLARDVAASRLLLDRGVVSPSGCLRQVCFGHSRGTGDLPCSPWKHVEVLVGLQAGLGGMPSNAARFFAVQ